MATADSVQITSGLQDNTNHQFARTVVRDSNGNIIAVASVGGTPTSFISSDDGSTWNSSSIGNGNADTCIAVAVDSADRLHVVYRNAANDDYYYQRYTQSTTGAVTKGVTDETIVAGGSPLSFGHCVIAVDSTDVPWVVANVHEQVKGTDLDYAELFDRTGGSWSSDGNIHGVGGQNDFTHFSIVIDDADVKHIAFANLAQGDTRYRTYDAGLSGAEAFGARKNGGMVLDGSGIPIVTTGDQVWKRTSGTWSSDQFTSDSVGQSTCTILDGTLRVIYADSATSELKENASTFGSFSTADVTVIENTTNGTWIKPSVYWQNHNYNPQNQVDIAVEDDGATDLYFDAVVTVFVTVTTLSASNITSTSVQLNGEVDWQDSQVEVWFEWRETGASTWNQTAKQTITTTGVVSFNESLTQSSDGISGDTEYEFRARADRDSGAETDIGSTLTFFTDLLISGVVDVAGNTVSGVVVYITQVDPSVPSAAVEVRTTTASDGSFGAEVPGGNEYHVAAQHDDGSTKYAGESKPYIT